MIKKENNNFILYSVVFIYLLMRIALVFNGINNIIFSFVLICYLIMVHVNVNVKLTSYNKRVKSEYYMTFILALLSVIRLSIYDNILTTIITVIIFIFLIGSTLLTSLKEDLIILDDFASIITGITETFNVGIKGVKKSFENISLFSGDKMGGVIGISLAMMFYTLFAYSDNELMKITPRIKDVLIKEFSIFFSSLGFSVIISVVVYSFVFTRIDTKEMEHSSGKSNTEEQLISMYTSGLIIPLLMLNGIYTVIRVMNLEERLMLSHYYLWIAYVITSLVVCAFFGNQSISQFKKNNKKINNLLFLLLLSFVMTSVIVLYSYINTMDYSFVIRLQEWGIIVSYICVIILLIILLIHVKFNKIFTVNLKVIILFLILFTLLLPHEIVLQQYNENVKIHKLLPDKQNEVINVMSRTGSETIGILLKLVSENEGSVTKETDRYAKEVILNKMGIKINEETVLEDDEVFLELIVEPKNTYERYFNLTKYFIWKNISKFGWMSF